MQPAIRFLKKDCVNLPPVVTVERQCQLSAKQASMFKSMKAAMITEAKGQMITAVNAADKVTKLRQILCGAIKNPKTDEYITVEHTSRFEVMMEAVENASGKVLIVAPFKGIIKPLADAIRKKKYSVGILNGDVTPRNRDRIVHEFKTQRDPHILLCHPKVMAHGLNFTEADTLIFYAPIYSNDEYQQVIERFNRQGQKRKMTIVRIGAHPLEWAIYRVVDTRGVTQDNILKLYHSVLN
jgi:SNF2 family DNA or RNA helicase